MELCFRGNVIMSNKTSSLLYKTLLDVKDVHFLRTVQRNTRRTHHRHLGSCAMVAGRMSSLQLSPVPSIRTPSCSFFNLAAPISSRRMEYAEHRTLEFTPEQIYSVVANVDQYQHFVPWCKKSRMTKGPNGDTRAELEIGFPPITERYTSELTFVPNHQIRAVCTDGSLFSHLETLWRFAPGAKDPPGSCKVYFFVSFEFKSVLHSQLASVFFDEVVKQMVGAFESHAATLYRNNTSFRRRPALNNH
ncbi:coenzyme Q-binding protein COQ10 homolog, mitochondrial [Austrofundulus limnaeus]|uniref:Coenzyme Q-binding protein COQ10 homolog, mitochondrial n=1 Tax=Austrofundulus limnaeus TaxID=52670 RepID=A0A2I4CBR8_AUSLI|nr:PREDICTED: coenzyme Q-binding protein COQ10 homolog, mitochondrial-like [Austrofundulus limnaeus]